MGSPVDTTEGAAPGASDGRVSGKAQRAIKRYILDRRLGPGDALPSEGQLAEELKISRNSVREAIKALEALGTIETRHGVGLFVRAFSFDPILDNLAYGIQVGNNSILELLEVRRQLEGAFVEVAAASLSADELRVLRSTVDRMGARAALGESFTDEDRFFHRTLYSGLGNRLLLTLLDVFWEAYVRLRASLPGVPPGDAVRTWEEHRAILELLERRDGPGARRAMLDNFVLLEGRLRHAVEVRSGPPGAPGAPGAPAPPPETPDPRARRTADVRPGLAPGAGEEQQP
jgi:DNA-binding FadR family transcriptional regulator